MAQREVFVEPGWEVYSADDHKIGQVAEARSNYLLVEKGFLFKKDLYIPASAIESGDEAGGRIYLTADKDQIETMGWDRMPQTTTTGTGTAKRTGTEQQTLRLREEQLTARKRQQQTGEVQVGKKVVSEKQTMDVPVTHEEAVIERHPVDRQPVGSFDQGRDETIKVPLMEEKVDVEKRPVVTEEVNVRKTPVTETRQVSDTVRREEAEIKNEGKLRKGK